MKSKISEKRKETEGWGAGTGANYKPYIKVNEFNSLGTTCNPVDWKTGRTMHFLSQGEMYLYYLLRFREDVIDIREQFPLELEETLAIAKDLGYKHPKNKSTRMTSDLLVDFVDGTQTVYSVKRSSKDIENKRTREKLAIEEAYWKAKDIDFKIIFTESLDINTVTNIRLVVEFYNKEDVYDEISYIKHLIATKQINVDLTKGLIDYSKLRKELSIDASNYPIVCR